MNPHPTTTPTERELDQALDRALSHALTGKTVLVVGPLTTLSDAFHRLVRERLPADDVRVVHRTNGRQGVELVSGGWLRFRSIDGARGYSADLLLTTPGTSEYVLRRLEVVVESHGGRVEVVGGAR